MTRLLAELAHYAAVLPLLACAVLWYRRRDPEPNVWLLACAFFVSFLADQVGARLAANGVNNWWVGYVYAPVQFALLVTVVTRRRAVQVMGTVFILLLGALSLIRGPVTEPETMVQVIGGLFVGWLAYDAPAVSRFRGPVLCYCLGTVPFLFAMAVIPWSSAWWAAGWAGYQIVRLVALGWLVRTLWAGPVLRLEASNGPGAHQVAGRHRATVRVAGGDHRHAMAAPAGQ